MLTYFWITINYNEIYIRTAHANAKSLNTLLKKISFNILDIFNFTLFLNVKTFRMFKLNQLAVQVTAS